MPFFPVDDDFAFHAKARAVGNAAVGLWTRAGAYCMKEATDGILQAHELDGLGKPAEARRLVEVRLWHAHGHDCDRCPQPPAGGWIFHDWADVGPIKTREQIKARREADRNRQREHRSRQASQRDNTRDSHQTPVVSHAAPSPSPYPSVVTEVSRLTLVGASVDLTDDDLDRISNKTGGGRDHARRVAAAVLERAGGEVRKPLSYVLRAVAAEPERHRYNGPVPKGAECPTHVGQLRDHCGPCRSERIAGGAR